MTSTDTDSDIPDPNEWYESDDGFVVNNDEEIAKEIKEAQEKIQNENENEIDVGNIITEGRSSRRRRPPVRYEPEEIPVDDYTNSDGDEEDEDEEDGEIQDDDDGDEYKPEMEEDTDVYADSDITESEEASDIPKQKGAKRKATNVFKSQKNT
jgi:hypothetical protein